MKGLCAKAGVESSRAFPHNLRHLFAATFYRATQDIVRLADVLGHSSIETTRIYLAVTGAEHVRLLERLGLVFISRAPESAESGPGRFPRATSLPMY